MDTKKLRQKILDLAIRGKLVPQDPNDEPASVLIEKIRAEKERLIKEKKIKRDKNESYIYRSDKSYYEKFADGTVKCIDDEIPFEIPESWEWCRLGSLCPSLQYGTSEKSQSEGEVAVLRMGNILPSGELCYDDLVFTSNESDIEKYVLLSGDLLFNRTNSSEWVGKTAIYRGDIPAIYAGYIIRFRPILLNLEYVNYLMNSGYEKDYCQSVKTDGVNQSNINAQKLANFLIPVPSSQEQSRLVFEIQNLFSSIATLEEDKSSLNKYIKQTKSKILDLAIRGKLVPQDPNDEPASVLLERIKSEQPESKKKAKNISDNSHYAFDMPNGWKKCQLGDLFEFIRNGIALTQHKGAIGIPITRIETISTGEINREKMGYANIIDTELYKNYYLLTNDILMSHINSPIHVGRSAIYENANSEEKIIHGMNLLCLRPSKNICAKYIYWYFCSAIFKNAIRPFVKNAVNQASINISNLNSIIFILPPLSEQKRIVKKIEEIFSTIDEVANSIKA